jgi:cysteine desulfurase family protein (TIGR01976 family)
VVFGRSMTQLTMETARTLAQHWGPGDEVVVTRLDHDSNIRSWVHAAERVGATVRWLDLDPATGELDDLAPLLTDRTRLVAFTAASNVLGTRPDVPALTALVREAGALSYVDAVHLVPHAPVSFDELGADFLACSPYKFFGPHHGVLVGRPDVLEGLHPDKLLPSSDAVPERFELGTLPYELLAGTSAAVEFIADLVPGAGTRRERVAASMRAVEAHEDALLTSLLDGLSGVEGLVLHGAPARRTPTLFFSIEGHPGPEVHAFLGERGVNAPSSSFYAIEASRRLGLGDTGAVRVGLAAYSTQGDVDRLVEGLHALVR